MRPQPVTTIAFVFNHSREKGRAKVGLRLAQGSYAAIDLMTEAAVPLASDGPWVGFETTLGPDGVQALKIRLR